MLFNNSVKGTYTANIAQLLRKRLTYHQCCTTTQETVNLPPTFHYYSENSQHQQILHNSSENSQLTNKITQLLSKGSTHHRQYTITHKKVNIPPIFHNYSENGQHTTNTA